MSNLPGRAFESPFYDVTPHTQSLSYPTQTKIVSTFALLVLGYYALSFFDAWPSTTKRTIYEFILYVTPSRLIYTMQYSLVRFGYLSQEDAKFKQADFGNMGAKQEAMRSIFRQPQLPLALQKARSLSGPFMTLNTETGPPGLGNWDNSCYQNSVLQGFASLPAFLEYMEQSDKLCIKFDIPAATHRALVAFLEQLANASGRAIVVWTPRVLKSMDSWQQQDAQEYFSRILEAVEKEAKRYAIRLLRSTSAGLECLGTFEKREAPINPDGEEQVMDSSRAGATLEMLPSGPSQRQLHNPVEGMTAQCLVCKTCGFTEGLSLTQFNCLTLNLGLQGETDIETLLEEYTASEEIEGVECDICTKLAHDEQTEADGVHNAADEAAEEPKEKKKPVLRTKAKQITVGRLPKDLVLHINRSIFDNYGSQLKNTAPVRFPARLDFLSRWCTPLDNDDGAVEAVYELKCAVTHYGSHHDGHYIALGKRDKDWYTFNDERVTRISEGEVLARGNAFMLFYEAVPAPPSNHVAEQAPPAIIASGHEVENIAAGCSELNVKPNQDSLIEAEDTVSKFSDSELLDSQSELDLSSDFSRGTTPASSESSSLVDAVAEEHEKRSDMALPHHEKQRERCRSVCKMSTQEQQKLYQYCSERCYDVYELRGHEQPA